MYGWGDELQKCFQYFGFIECINYENKYHKNTANIQRNKVVLMPNNCKNISQSPEFVY